MVKVPRKIKKGFKNNHFTKMSMTNRRRWLETKQVKYAEDFTEKDRQDLEAIYKRFDKPYPVTKWVRRALVVMPGILMYEVTKAVERLNNALDTYKELKSYEKNND